MGLLAVFQLALNQDDASTASELCGVRGLSEEVRAWRDRIPTEVAKKTGLCGSRWQKSNMTTAAKAALVLIAQRGPEGPLFHGSPQCMECGDESGDQRLIPVSAGRENRKLKSPKPKQILAMAFSLSVR